MKTHSVSNLLVCILSIALLSPALRGANVSLVAASTRTPGNEVDQQFWGSVVQYLNNPTISDSTFAIDALEAWLPYENTAACWNPLATTWEMPGSWDFNSVGVQNYLDQDTGSRATANTLNLSYYDAIRRMLARQSFDRDGIIGTLNTWSGHGAYVSSLVQQWENLYNSTSVPVADSFSAPISGEGWKIPCHNCQFNSRSTRYSTPSKGIYHAGEDWSKWDKSQNVSQNQPVYAIANGIVKYARDANFPYSVVIIEHILHNGEIWYSLYGHLGSLSVSEGQTVYLGNQIGAIAHWVRDGQNASHLHFEIRNFYVRSPMNSGYAPANGYWPTRNSSTDPYIGEQPTDRGWTEPSAFIEAHKCSVGSSCSYPSDSPPVSTGHFPDVDIHHTFYLYIETLYSIGAISGYSDGYFRPDDDTTRGAVAKIIVLGLGEGVNYVDGRQTFPDVAPSHTFYHFIERLYELGITSGYSDGTYRPDDPLSRGALAKFVTIAHDGSEPSYSTCAPPFPDVSCSHTFYPHIRRLKEIFDQKGIGLGYSDGTFKPDDNITRGGTAKIIVVGLDMESLIPTFPDVLYDNPFYTYIEGIAERQIISGYSDGTYRPYENTTRGQAAKFIIRGLGESPYYTDGRQSFPDVPSDNTFYHYIERMYELGITSGFSDGTYRPDDSLTRAGVAKFIIRALGENPYYTDDRQSFSDVPPSHQFYHYIERLYELHITSGYSDGTFRPDNPIDRGGMAKFTYLAFVQHATAASQEPSTLSSNYRSTAPAYSGWARYVVPVNDKDWIKLSVASISNISTQSSTDSSQAQYRLSAIYPSRNADIQIEVYSSSGNRLAMADGSSSNGGTTLLWTPPGTGTYYVRLTNDHPYAVEGVHTYFIVEQELPLDSELVGYWPFEEGSGTVVSDVTSNNNDGTVYNATWVKGKVGLALHFDGSGDYVEIPDSSSLDISDQMTIAAWVKPDSICDNNNPLVQKDDSYGLKIISSRQAMGFIWSGFEPHKSSTLLSTDVWYYLVAVFNNGVHEIYVNGVLENQSIDPVTSIPISTNPVYFAKGAFGCDFAGTIDQVRIYKTAITSYQVQNLYRQSWSKIYLPLVLRDTAP